MKSRRALVLLPLLALAIVLIAVPVAGAADSADVQCTVTIPAKLIAVEVTPVAVDFGTMEAGQESGLQACNITNVGNVDQRIWMRTSLASNDTSGTWMPGTEPGADVFMVRAGSHQPGQLTGSEALGLGNTSIGLWPEGTSASAPLTFYAPTSISQEGQYGFAVTVVATEL